MVVVGDRRCTAASQLPEVLLLLQVYPMHTAAQQLLHPHIINGTTAILRWLRHSPLAHRVAAAAGAWRASRFPPLELVALLVDNDPGLAA